MGNPEDPNRGNSNIPPNVGHGQDPWQRPQQSFNPPPQSPPPSGPYGGQPPFYGQSPPPIPGGGSGKAALSLILGILGIVLTFVGGIMSAAMAGLGEKTSMYVGIVISVASVIMTVVGLVLGVSARKTMPAERRGLATAGMVIGIVGVVMTVLVTTICTCSALVAWDMEYARIYNWNSLFD